MSNKDIFKVVIAFGLLAAVLVFLAARFVPETSAVTPANNANGTGLNLAGSDWVERHPAVASQSVNYIGSDWIERHPAAAFGSVNYAGSDWIERHPSAAFSSVSYNGSDWIERHPSNYYAGSDWIERHPGQPGQ